MPDDDGLATAIAQAERRQVSVRALLLGTGPRFTRDAIFVAHLARREPP